MLDAKQLADLVEQEIKTAVSQQVREAVSQTAWIEQLESQIIEFVQERIYAKFSNIGNLPDLVDAVERSTARIFEQGFVPDLTNYVDAVKIKQTVDQAVERFVERTIDNLAIDPQWVTKIENLVQQRVIDRIGVRINEVDVNHELHSVLLENKDAILGELRDNFSSTGICDQATKTQLTVMDGVVVAEGELVSNDLTVARNTHLRGDLLLNGDLAVQGRINVDNDSWHDLGTHIGNVTYDRFKNDFAAELIDNVIEQTKAGIEIENISVGDQPLLSGDTLSASIRKSNLSQVGTLDNLEVTGSASLSQTLTVTRGRVGVNTVEPDSALSVWDEEVNISASKYSKNAGFLGTGRRQNLVIGTNRQNHIEVDTDGITTIQKLRVGRNSLSFGSETPNYSGTKGDIVFNTNQTADAPFAWICLGAFRWQTLRAIK